MFLFTGTFHFLIEEKLISLIPEFIPLRLEIVYFSGIMELIFAGGFLFPKTRTLTGKISIIFLILVFPVMFMALSNMSNLPDMFMDRFIYYLDCRFKCFRFTGLFISVYEEHLNKMNGTFYFFNALWMV